MGLYICSLQCKTPHYSLRSSLVFLSVLDLISQSHIPTLYPDLAALILYHPPRGFMDQHSQTPLRKGRQIRIMVADDHQFYRQGVRVILASAAHLEIVGEAQNGQQAVEMAHSLEPDVILMDIKMPIMSGIEATRHIHRQHPQIALLILSMLDDDDSVFAALREGASGYVLKDAGYDELLRAIEAVANGEAIFSQSIARRMMSYFGAGAGGRRPVSQHSALEGEAFAELTERETTILKLASRGASLQEISELLHISLKTVRNHFTNIYTKLQVTDRTQAVIKARNAGIY
jgi:DNA-binding NarL/FixJ family response regulator